MIASALTPAAKRREARKQKRRSDIIDAALHVFSRVGFAAAKIDDVADEASVSKGTLYLYFSSKEDLFKGMVIGKMLPIFDEIEAVSMHSGTSAEARVRALMRFFYQNILNSDRRHIMRLIMAEGPNFPQLTAFYYDNVISRGEAMVQDILDYGVSRGEFRALSGHGITKNVIAGAIAASIWKTVFDSHQPIDLAAYCETHIDLLLGGLRA